MNSQEHGKCLARQAGGSGDIRHGYRPFQKSLYARNSRLPSKSSVDLDFGNFVLI